MNELFLHIVQELSTICKEYTDTIRLDLESRKLFFPYSPELLQRLQSAFPDIVSQVRDEIEVELLANKGFTLFYDIADFLRWLPLLPQNNNNEEKRDFAIIHYENGPLYCEATTQRVYSEGGEVLECTIIHNILGYWKILSLLSQDKGSNLFCTHKDALDRKLIVIVPDKGKLEIDYPKTPPDLSVDTQKLYSSLSSYLEKKEFIPFFKVSVYEELRLVAKDRFVHLVEQLEKILKNAQENFDLYLSSFSFEKIKKELRQDKEKYFGAIRDILSKIYAQVIGTSLLISTTTFAATRVQGEIAISCLLLAIYGLYTAFAWHMLKNLQKDIEEVKGDVDTERANFKQYHLPLKDIEAEYDKIDSRIATLTRTNMWVQCLIGGLTIIAAIFLLYPIFTG